MMEERKPFPPELIARILDVGSVCILAGCITAETIAQCRRTVEIWVEQQRTGTTPRAEGMH